MASDDREPMIVPVSETGTISIPAELRREHGIETGGQVELRTNDRGDLVVERTRRRTGFRGKGSASEKSATELLRDLRGPE